MRVRTGGHMTAKHRFDPRVLRVRVAPESAADIGDDEKCPLCLQPIPYGQRRFCSKRCRTRFHNQRTTDVREPESLVRSEYSKRPKASDYK